VNKQIVRGSGMEILIVYCLLSLLFVSIGGYLFIRNFRRILKIRSMVDWPKTEATITECEVKYEDQSNGALPKVLVQYEYKVSHHKYENDKIHPTMSSLWWVAKYPQLCDRLKRSTVVMAWYNPSDPSESYLVAGSLYDHRSDLFVGVYMLIFSICFFLSTCFYHLGDLGYATALEVVK
jgi:hypothetical protein